MLMSLSTWPLARQRVGKMLRVALKHPCSACYCTKTSWLCLLIAPQDWFLTTRTFPVPVLELRDTLIAATMDVYATVAAQLLPTPTKSHYIFNLRDFSRWAELVHLRLPGMPGLCHGHSRIESLLQCC
jgi:hypothetical protein